MNQFSRLLFATTLFGVSVCGNILAESVNITAIPSKGAFPIVGTRGETTSFVVDPADAEVVATVAGAVSDDIRLITGKTPTLTNSLKGVKYPIIAGTIGKSSFIDKLAAEGKIDTSDIAGKWEAYGLAVVEKPAKGVERALVVYGSTPRGTAYALFEISKLMGVSPYVWWADVTPEKRNAIYATPGKTVVGEPSVKFRGIFINDEDWGLMPWAAKNIDAKYNNIGPNTYAKVMELLLRLRANVLWPAMHLCSQAFWDNKENIPVAKRYDIALGSSHCEQMLRDNEWEWRRYEDGSGTYDNWNYVINKDKIQRYWEERVAESKGVSAMYTLGMRGVHDWGISGYPSTEDKVRGLTEIIGYQRSLIKKHIGEPNSVPQIFIPYKEVLDAYNAGLQVPEDVILTWVDDNHGYIRQLPTEKEQLRKGGHGVYYHLSYWGTPSDYLWLSSISPSLISYELVKGYENGIRDLWVINVGDIKPAEEELEFCMDLAWDIDAWQPENAYRYSRHWAAKTFGEDVADDIADIKLEYYELAAAGKPEHVFGVAYNDSEMDQRISRYRQLVDKVETLKSRIPERLEDAFYELVEYPVKGAYLMNVKTFRAKQSFTLANAGQREKALAYSDEAHKAFDSIIELTEKYNKGIADGKWDGMMDYKPRNLQQFFMPETASAAGISSLAVEMPTESYDRIPAVQYSAVSEGFKEFKNLGISGSSIAVWRMDNRNYSSAEISEAPYVEYIVPVKSGENMIEARFLPTFPIHSGDSLDVGISINGAEPEVLSLKTVATQGKWHTTVMQGFNDATVRYDAKQDGNVKLRVSMMNPGIALSEIYVRYPADNSTSLTDKLLINPDFEYDSTGTLNTDGDTQRGVPYGWNIVGNLAGNSFGINNDAKNYNGNNLCWMNSFPMPEEFELSQTIESGKLPEGTYLVRCRLWVEENKKGTCRLFANNQVQYFGFESDYPNLLTPGEDNTFAGYTGSNSDNFQLKEMAVAVRIKNGEDLKIGIRTSNKKKDGTFDSTGNNGWFKVDHFRLDRLN